MLKPAKRLESQQATVIRHNHSRSSKKNNDKNHFLVNGATIHLGKMENLQHKQFSNIGIKTLSLILSLLMLQTQFIMSAALKPVFAAVNNENVTDALSEQHCVTYLGANKTLKEIGSVWISADNPCVIYNCDVNNKGLAQVMANEENCKELYCDVDSELRPQNGSCCGTCVRTKCRFNNNIYEIGETWHNEKDCTLLECTQLPNGQPLINAYKKTCAPFPSNCPPQDVYIENCCQYCKRSRTSGLDIDGKNDIWTKEHYRNHECVRECKVNEPPRTCHYNFVVEWYETLSKACFDCPQNVTDCHRPHCVLGDGIARSITVVNRMMPGPAIEVCENDVIIVDVRNDLLGESTTIHWHGLHQRQSPYMDGVPHISQCPISPHSTFRYTFKADSAGTHFWHSHTGMQRGDGVFGALIVRRPRLFDPHAHLYDFDLSEHAIILQDWIDVPGVSMFAAHHHSRGDNKPHNILVNGRGRYYKAIWESIKKDFRFANEVNKANIEIVTPPTTSSTTTTTLRTTGQSATMKNILDHDLNSEVDFLHTLDDEHLKLRFKQSNEISRLARVARQQMESPEKEINSIKLTSNSMASTKENKTLPKQSRGLEKFAVPLDKMPLETFNVRKGFRYRFRIINAEFLNCPVALSIDNHTLTAINSDSYDFEAVEVGSIVTYAGERFDFVVHADQEVGNYWVRLKGLMDCSPQFTSAFQVAILHYDNADNAEPTAPVGYNHMAPGIELNVMNRGSGHVDSLTIAELSSLPSYDNKDGIDRDILKPEADYKFFVYYDFYPKDNPTFHNSELYGFNSNLSGGIVNRLTTPQLNHISLKFPSSPLLPSRNEFDDSKFCNETSLAEQGIDCRKQFCSCHHVLQVPLNAVVEFIIVDEGFTFDANHPFHLHGNAFRVLGLERLGKNVTIEMVKQLDRYNLLKRNFNRPPVKDTVTIPDGGYTIIRFRAYNPGFWLFHCHIEFHAEIGMALILKVGNNNEMPPAPKGFPSCHDYMPDSWSEAVTSSDSMSTVSSQTSDSPLKPGENAGNVLQASLFLIVCSHLMMFFKKD